MEYESKAPEIELREVRLGYPGRLIIDGVTATIPRGRITAILGGSGSGKSTLLKGILGLLTPISGEILIDGEDITTLNEDEMRELKQSMGVLFQDGALLGSLTVGENVALPLQEHTDLAKELIEEMVRMKLRLVGLEETMHYYPRELSGGMRKRAGLARAMIMDPRILLCDEPSAGLDPITAAELDRLVVGLNQTFPMTIVAVTHDLESMKATADRVIMLGDKKLLYDGELDGLLKSEDTYIQKFLNRNPD